MTARCRFEGVCFAFSSRPVRTELHAHTTASDGHDTPGALVARAHAAGIGLLAITDHDTLDGVPEAVDAARRFGVGLVAAAELSASVAGVEVHLLAYGVRPDHAALRDHLDGFREIRKRRAEEMVERLNAIGVPVRLDAVQARAGSGVLARPHLAAEIVAVGAASSIAEAFTRYLHDGGPADVPKPAFEAKALVRLVHDAGGLAVLAHPGLLPSDAVFDAALQTGLDGLEVRHPMHSWATTRWLGEEARRAALLETGGSDFHGRPADLPRLGRYQPAPEVIPLLRRVV